LILRVGNRVNQNERRIAGIGHEAELVLEYNKTPMKTAPTVPKGLIPAHKQ
jgi:hypothetical protein